MANVLSYDIILKENLRATSKYPLCHLHNNEILYFCECGKPACEACKNEFHADHKTEGIGMIIKPTKNEGLTRYWTSLIPLHPLSYYIKLRFPSFKSEHKMDLMKNLDDLEEETYPKSKLFLQKNMAESGSSNIYIFEVEVQVENGLKVIEKNPELKEDFFSASDKNLVKVVWIESKSVHVVESKLRVYEEFKDLIDLKKILIHHASENHQNLLEYKSLNIFKQMYDQLFCFIILNDLSTSCTSAINAIFKRCFDRDQIRQIAYSEHLPPGKSIHFVQNIFRKIAERLQDEIYNHLSKVINGKLIYKIQHENYNSTLEKTVKRVYLEWDNSKVHPDAYRTYIADLIFKVLNSNEGQGTFKRMARRIVKVLKSTHDDALTIFNRWRNVQREFVNEWENNTPFLESEALKYPDVISCIFGEKNKLAVAKVFLRKSDAEVQKYFENKCKQFGCDPPHFVDISTASEKMREKKQKIKMHEQSATSIDPNTTKTLKMIIKDKAEKLLANHSTVVGLGISKVRQEGNEIVNEPCIAVYCLDETLRPYGENQLPMYLEGFRLDIREDYVMLGHCRNCENQNPHPGCDIGRPSCVSAGSIGFLVGKSHNEIIQTESGFLTAAHVAIKHFLNMYKSNSLLTKIDMGKDDHEIIHPSESGKRIGKVVESFCGNFGNQETGLDIAFVKTDMPLGGEQVELIFPDEGNLTCDGSMNVIKMGRTTGLTKGTLDQDNFLVCVKCDQGGFLYFNDCYLIGDKADEPFFLEGDSGSGVFLDVTQNKPLGIAFARLNSSTAVCKVKSFLDHLNLSVLAHQTQEAMDVS